MDQIKTIFRLQHSDTFSWTLWHSTWRSRKWIFYSTWDAGELLLRWDITHYMTSMKTSSLCHRDSHVSPIHDQPLHPLLHTCYVKYRIYVGWRFSLSNVRCLAGEFEHSSHLKTLALRLWRKMIYREAVSVSAGSKQTSDPAPPSRSDAENILPVLNPDILLSLTGS